MPSNPYLEEFLKLQRKFIDRHNLYRVDQWKWHATFSTETDIFSKRHELVTKYSWAVPWHGALEVIAAHAPILEIGAGTGYWVYLLRQMGVDVLAYDAEPPFEKENVNTWHHGGQIWTAVFKAGSFAAGCDPTRALFLCWPPYDNSMAMDCLNRYQGNVIIYIGENGGCTGTEEFQKALDERFDMVARADIPQYEGIHDFLMLYYRKGCGRDVTKSVRPFTSKDLYNLNHSYDQCPLKVVICNRS